jgi:hypothetical protein
LFETEKMFFASTEDCIRSLDEIGFSNETILLKGARDFTFERIAKLLQQKAHETVLEIDLKNWSDKRAPDGTTILAPAEQATPADYPGIKPEKMVGELLLFDLEKDPTESTDLSGNYPQIKQDMIRKYNEFLKSTHQ